MFDVLSIFALIFIKNVPIDKLLFYTLNQFRLFTTLTKSSNQDFVLPERWLSEKLKGFLYQHLTAVFSQLCWLGRISIMLWQADIMWPNETTANSMLCDIHRAPQWHQLSQTPNMICVWDSGRLNTMQINATWRWHCQSNQQTKHLRQSPVRIDVCLESWALMRSEGWNTCLQGAHGLC